MHRRNFLRFAGASAAATTLLVVAACNKDDDMTTPGGSTGTSVNLGTGDIGILNYAYALEQLEAAFYIQVIQTQYTGITAAETAMLTDIRDHEVAHREFFKAALGTMAIAGLTPDFTSINFTNRASVLGAAKAFEDLGVSAYNGAGKLIKDATYLTLAGKIVSVEARHAAYIRNLISSGSFANSEVIDANGLEIHKDPAAVLAIAGKFVKNTIDFSGLPK
ncbi:MAG: ferritin-like domain-containing protein [Cytophagaceae bacterium]|nr:ferritin-like domain-containing protein [Cytophagaceae bacterium]